MAVAHYRVASPRYASATRPYYLGPGSYSGVNGPLSVGVSILGAMRARQDAKVAQADAEVQAQHQELQNRYLESLIAKNNEPGAGRMMINLPGPRPEGAPDQIPYSVTAAQALGWLPSNDTEGEPRDQIDPYGPNSGRLITYNQRLAALRLQQGGGAEVKPVDVLTEGERAGISAADDAVNTAIQSELGNYKQNSPNQTLATQLLTPQSAPPEVLNAPAVKQAKQNAEATRIRTVIAGLGRSKSAADTSGVLSQLPIGSPAMQDPAFYQVPQIVAQRKAYVLRLATSGATKASLRALVGDQADPLYNDPDVQAAFTKAR